MTRCPKCSGFLIQENIREHGGFFHGWRCIQCGLRLDELIVQNRVDSVPAGDDSDEFEAAPRPRKLRRTPART
jgi:hypothetical protein